MSSHMCSTYFLYDNRINCIQVNLTVSLKNRNGSTKSYGNKDVLFTTNIREVVEFYAFFTGADLTLI